MSSFQMGTILDTRAHPPNTQVQFPSTKKRPGSKSGPLDDFHDNRGLDLYSTRFLRNW